MDKADTDEDRDKADTETWIRFLRASDNLRRAFRQNGRLNLSIASLTKDSITLDVEIGYESEHGFAFYIDDVAEGDLRLWKDGNRVSINIYFAARRSKIDIDVKPGESFVYSFVGQFRENKLMFPDVGFFPGIGDSFEVEYWFLSKVSNRVHVTIPK